MTEIRVLDTYWSDHCRHTTFLTELKNVTFEDGDYKAPVEKTYNEYKKAHPRPVNNMPKTMQDYYRAVNKAAAQNQEIPSPHFEKDSKLVDFPDPFFPTIAIISPFFTEKLIFFRTCLPFLYLYDTFSIIINIITPQILFIWFS